jgi:RNA polymerase sigma factor (sigma-70 family)
MTEQQVIEQLSQYRRKQARIHVLSTYSVGGGVTVSRLNEDDQLQELHAKLRGKPSYMYLSGYEQRLENIAYAYMTRYPAGVKAQQRAIPVNVMDEEDRELLQDLRHRIQKVVAARGYDLRDDIDKVLDRLAEFQDLRADINRIDTVMNALEHYKPEYEKLLRLRYVEDLPAGEVAKQLGIVRKTFDRWRNRAIKEYIRLVS